MRVSALRVSAHGERHAMGRKAQRRERRREAYHELREGHGPVSMDIRACLLVVHIVCCVTDIPGPHSTHAHQISSQGQNTCQVHNVTSTLHQSSCTRPWACGPSVRARAASLGSLPILMNPSFRAAIHPNPPPQDDCLKEKSLRRQGSGAARDSAARKRLTAIVMLVPAPGVLSGSAATAGPRGTWARMI